MLIIFQQRVVLNIQVLQKGYRSSLWQPSMSRIKYLPQAPPIQSSSLLARGTSPSVTNLWRESPGCFCGQKEYHSQSLARQWTLTRGLETSQEEMAETYSFFFLLFSDFPALIREGVILVAAEASCCHRN